MLLIYRYMDHNVHSFKLLLLFCTLLKKMIDVVLKSIEKNCGRSAMLYGSETWCLREIEVSILRRTKRAMLRESVERRAKQMDKKNTDKLIQMLRLSENVENLAKTSSIPCYGHVLRRDEDGASRNVQRFKMKGQKKTGRPRKTWRQVENKIRDCVAEGRHP